MLFCEKHPRRQRSLSLHLRQAFVAIIYDKQCVTCVIEELLRLLRSLVGQQATQLHCDEPFARRTCQLPQPSQPALAVVPRHSRVPRRVDGLARGQDQRRDLGEADADFSLPFLPAHRLEPPREIPLQVLPGQVPVDLLSGDLPEKLDLPGFLEAGDHFLHDLPEPFGGQRGPVGAREHEEEGETDVAAGVLGDMREEIVGHVLDQLRTIPNSPTAYFTILLKMSCASR